MYNGSKSPNKRNLGEWYSVEILNSLFNGFIYSSLFHWDFGGAARPVHLREKVGIGIESYEIP